MPTAYSLDLRVRILHDCQNDIKRPEIAKKYSVSLSSVYNFRKQYNDTNSLAPRTCQRGRKLKLAPYEQEVRQLVVEHPDATLVELCEKLSPHVSVCPAALCNFLHRLKITWKKNALSCRTTSKRCCRTTRRMEAMSRNP